MTALAKFKLAEWPFPGPVALLERDEFGMREDYHVINRWRYLGTAHDDASVHELLEIRSEAGFDADYYRIIKRFLKAGKVRVLRLPASAAAGSL